MACPLGLLGRYSVVAFLSDALSSLIPSAVASTTVGMLGFVRVSTTCCVSMCGPVVVAFMASGSESGSPPRVTVIGVGSVVSTVVSEAVPRVTWTAGVVPSVHSGTKVTW